MKTLRIHVLLIAAVFLTVGLISPAHAASKRVLENRIGQDQTTSTSVPAAKAQEPEQNPVVNLPENDPWKSGRWFHGFHQGRQGWWWIVNGRWYYYSSPTNPYPDRHRANIFPRPMETIIVTPPTVVHQTIIVPPAEPSASDEKLMTRIRDVQNWIRWTCPAGDYATCLYSGNIKGQFIDEGNVVIHMGAYMNADAKNPFSTSDEDICVVFNRHENDALYIIVPKFDDEATCDLYANRTWPNATGVGNHCSETLGRWMRHIAIVLDKKAL